MTSYSNHAIIYSAGQYMCNIFKFLQIQLRAQEHIFFTTCLLHVIWAVDIGRKNHNLKQIQDGLDWVWSQIRVRWSKMGRLSIKWHIAFCTAFGLLMVPSCGIRRYSTYPQNKFCYLIVCTLDFSQKSCSSRVLKTDGARWANTNTYEVSL